MSTAGYACTGMPARTRGSHRPRTLRQSQSPDSEYAGTARSAQTLFAAVSDCTAAAAARTAADSAAGTEGSCHQKARRALSGSDIRGTARQSLDADSGSGAEGRQFDADQHPGKNLFFLQDVSETGTKVNGTALQSQYVYQIPPGQKISLAADSCVFLLGVEP